MKKTQFKEFSSSIIENMNIDEDQKSIMQAMMENTIDSLTDSNISDIEKQIRQFLEEREKSSSVFD